MKLLFASDSFKGTLSSRRTAELLTLAAREVMGDDVDCDSVLMADGGEGTTDAVIEVTGGARVSVSVEDPLGEPVEACYGIIDRESAIMEMSTASGLTLIPVAQRNPLKTSTYGTGQLILDALNRGIRHFYIAIGGSATNDGGMGCLRALGARFLDASGNELLGRGEDLASVASIDLRGLDKRIAKTCFTVMCDVTNPLCGPQGATYTFAAQKGATPEMQEILERGMENYRQVIVRQIGIDPNDMPGSGAAGGLGAALLTFLGAKLCSGIETVLQLTHFDDRMKTADLVITGEGRTDWQSCFGKVVQGVGDHCKRFGVKAIALVGCKGPGAEQVLDHGIDRIVETCPEGMSVEEAMCRAEELYRDAAIALMKELAGPVSPCIPQKT